MAHRPPHQRHRQDPRHRASTIGIILMATGLGCAAGAIAALAKGEPGLGLLALLFALICAYGTTSMYRIAALPGFCDPHDPDTRMHG